VSDTLGADIMKKIIRNMHIVKIKKYKGLWIISPIFSTTPNTYFIKPNIQFFKMKNIYL